MFHFGSLMFAIIPLLSRCFHLMPFHLWILNPIGYYLLVVYLQMLSYLLHSISILDFPTYLFLMCLLLPLIMESNIHHSIFILSVEIFRRFHSLLEFLVFRLYLVFILQGLLLFLLVLIVLRLHHLLLATSIRRFLLGYLLMRLDVLYLSKSMYILHHLGLGILLCLGSYMILQNSNRLLV